MNEPNDYPDECIKGLLRDQLAAQGIETIYRGQSKETQVAKELAEEQNWPPPSHRSTAKPKAQGEDNNYYNGLSQ